MPNNDPLKSVENIVQLQSARRAMPVATVQAPRPKTASAVLFTSWVITRDRAAAALLSGTKRLLLTGPAGTGKTVLVEYVARVLRAAGRTVIIQLADAEPAPPDVGMTLIVDEADRLSAAKLKQLFDESAGTVVLTGLAPLVRRVATGTMQLTLEPLDQVDAQEYIAQWLALNGRTPAELDSKAVRALVELSGGVPRLLSTLLAAAAWLAKTGNAPIIQAGHIKEAAELRSVLVPPAAPEIAIIERPRARSGRRVLWSVLLTGVVLLGAVVAIAPRLFPAEIDRAVALATPLGEQIERWLRIAPAAPPSRRVQIVKVADPTVPQTAAPAAAVPPPILAAPQPVSPAAPIEPAPVAAPALPEPPKSEPVPPAPEPIQAAPEPLPAAQEPVPNPAPETKHSDTTPSVAAMPAAPAPSVVAPVEAPTAASSPALPVETIEFLLRRGREMLALNDLSAARLLFARAAEGGSPEAMFDVGQTYDPAFLTAIGGARQADQAEALRWYRRAAARGYNAAERLLPKQ